MDESKNTMLKVLIVIVLLTALALLTYFVILTKKKDERAKDKPFIFPKATCKRIDGCSGTFKAKK